VIKNSKCFASQQRFTFILKNKFSLFRIEFTQLFKSLSVMRWLVFFCTLICYPKRFLREYRIYSRISNFIKNKSLPFNLWGKFSSLKNFGINQIKILFNFELCCIWLIKSYIPVKKFENSFSLKYNFMATKPLIYHKIMLSLLSKGCSKL
jgi:hypothetical protein